VTAGELQQVLTTFPCVHLYDGSTPVEPLRRLSEILGGGPSLWIKRDDAIAFGFGGNKVRKLALVAGKARAERADVLITAGGVQSNHARATAATAVRLGIRAILVANGQPQQQPTANALLDRLLGADVVYVDSREERQPKIAEIADRCRDEGRRPFAIPIGASTPLGALAFALAVAELVGQIPAPDVIVHSSSSGGTQAGLVAGCRLLGLPTRVVGISADAPSAVLQADIAAILSGVADLLRIDPATLTRGTAIEVDDRFVGRGYGIPSDASTEALELTARTEAVFLDPTYTAKAMAGLIAYVREQTFVAGQTVLFWHTGGQVGLFA
jgi:1-aminocyclopropane-1-carboxylate deaminase/D-cysteine desulfhydrase-like pyridoxal-dependent ACC family enzyme